jgi:hypothetical protein
MGFLHLKSCLPFFYPSLAVKAKSQFYARACFSLFGKTNLR